MMARNLFQPIAILIIMTSIFVGCRLLEETPKTQVNEEPTAQHPAEEITEADLVEDMKAAGETYVKSIERLIEYYTEIDNKLKLQWAKKELDALGPKYGPPPKLGPIRYQAIESIRQADDLFYEAQALGRGIIDSDRKDILRRQLQKYEQLIRDYPTSDKIDDAALFAGLFLEADRNYVAALYYYMSAFKRDPETPYPARFKAAYILDKHLHRYNEAFELYIEAIKLEGRNGKHRQWKELAEARIREIEKLGEDK